MDPCAICGEPLDGRKTLLLFGHRTHKECRGRFDLRRELAYVLDMVALYVLLTIALLLLIPGGNADSGDPALAIAFLLVEVLFVGLFLAKDSVRGISFGKLVTGLQVIDDDSGKPIGLRQSLMRNLIVLVPLMPIVLAFQMRGGPRIGEGWANTRVVMRKRRDAPAFAAAQKPPEDWSSKAGWSSRDASV